jgi:hypothetical protein
MTLTGRPKDNKPPPKLPTVIHVWNIHRRRSESGEKPGEWRCRHMTSYSGRLNPKSEMQRLKAGRTWQCHTYVHIGRPSKLCTMPTLLWLQQRITLTNKSSSRSPTPCLTLSVASSARSLFENNTAAPSLQVLTLPRS